MLQEICGILWTMRVSVSHSQQQQCYRKTAKILQHIKNLIKEHKKASSCTAWLVNKNVDPIQLIFTIKIYNK